MAEIDEDSMSRDQADFYALLEEDALNAPKCVHCKEFLYPSDAAFADSPVPVWRSSSEGYAACAAGGWHEPAAS